MSFVRICGTDDRRAWLAARRTGLGASEAPALFGKGFRSLLETYQQKLSTEEIPEEEEQDSELTRWGRLLEPIILNEFARETGRRVEHGGQLLRSREWPWMLATLDAEQAIGSGKPPREFEAVGPGTMEGKNTRWLAGEWQEGEIPRRIWIQKQQQLAVTGRQWGSVAVLLFGSQFLWADVQRDDKFINEVLVPAGQEFWQRVEQRRPCAPDGTDSARKALQKLYPDAVPGKVLTLPGELLEFDEERQALKESLAKMEARLKHINQSFAMALGDAEYGILSNGAEYSYKKQSRKSYTVAAAEFRVLRRKGER